MTFLSRGYGDRCTGLEWNIPEHDFFEDDKSGINRDVVIRAALKEEETQ